MSPQKHYDAIIIGAGVSGLYQLHRLREAGFSVHTTGVRYRLKNQENFSSNGTPFFKTP
jgi:monoamine oxidase